MSSCLYVTIAQRLARKAALSSFPACHAVRLTTKIWNFKLHVKIIRFVFSRLSSPVSFNLLFPCFCFFNPLLFHFFNFSSYFCHVKSLKVIYHNSDLMQKMLRLFTSFSILSLVFSDNLLTHTHTHTHTHIHTYI